MTAQLYKKAGARMLRLCGFVALLATPSMAGGDKTITQVAWQLAAHPDVFQSDVFQPDVFQPDV